MSRYGEPDSDAGYRSGYHLPHPPGSPGRVKTIHTATLSQICASRPMRLVDTIATLALLAVRGGVLLFSSPLRKGVG